MKNRVKDTEIDYKNVIEDLDRIIDNLNFHWHSIELLLAYVSQPLKIDDRGLINTIRYTNDQFKDIINSIRNLDVKDIFNEIRYVGSRCEFIIEKIENLEDRVKEISNQKNEEDKEGKTSPEEFLKTKLVYLDDQLSISTVNRLIKCGLYTVKDIVDQGKEKLNTFKGISKKSMNEVIKLLSEHGVEF